MGTASTYPRSIIQKTVNLGTGVSTPKTTTRTSTVTKQNFSSNTAKTTVKTTNVGCIPKTTVTSKPTYTTNLSGCGASSFTSSPSPVKTTASTTVVNPFNNLKDQVNRIDLGNGLVNNNTGCRPTAQVTHITSNLNSQTGNLNLSPLSSQRGNGVVNQVNSNVQPVNSMGAVNRGAFASNLGSNVSNQQMAPVYQYSNVRPTPTTVIGGSGASNYGSVFSVSPNNQNTVRQNSGVRPYTPSSGSSANISLGGCIPTMQNSGIRPNSSNVTVNGSIPQGINLGSNVSNQQMAPVYQYSNVRPYTPSSGSSANISLGGCIPTIQNSGIRPNSSNTTVNGSIPQGINSGCLSASQNSGIRPNITVNGTVPQSNAGVGCLSTSQNSGIRPNSSNTTVNGSLPQHNNINAGSLSASQNSGIRPSVTTNGSASQLNNVNAGSLSASQNSGIRPSVTVNGTVPQNNAGIGCLSTSQNSGIRPNSSNVTVNGSIPQGINSGCLSVAQSSGIRPNVTVNGSFPQGSVVSGSMPVNISATVTPSQMITQRPTPEFKPGEKGNLEHDDIDYSRINRSADKVEQGKFMGRDHIWDDQWGDDGQLRYEVKEDGSILIYEDDVAMGWTDQEGLRALKENGTTTLKTPSGELKTYNYGSLKTIDPSQNFGVRPNAANASINGSFPQGTNSGCLSVSQNTVIRPTNGGSVPQSSLNTENIIKPNNEVKDTKPAPEFKPGEKGNLEHDDIDYSRINRSADKVEQGKFMGRDHIWDDQWGDDGQLRYEVKEDGSILIYEDDVAMGWTDQEGLRALKENGTTTLKTPSGELKTYNYGSLKTIDPSQNSGIRPNINSGSSPQVAPTVDSISTTQNSGVRPYNERVNSKVVINSVSNNVGPDGRSEVRLSDGTITRMNPEEIASYQPTPTKGTFVVNKDVVINRVGDLGPDGRRDVFLSNGTTQRLNDEQIYDMNKYGYYGKPIDYIETSVQNNGDPVKPQAGIYTYHYKDGTETQKLVTGEELEKISKMSSYGVTSHKGIGVTHDRIYVDPLKLDEKVAQYNKNNEWDASNIREYKPVNNSSTFDFVGKVADNIADLSKTA